MASDAPHPIAAVSGGAGGPDVGRSADEHQHPATSGFSTATLLLAAERAIDIGAATLSTGDVRTIDPHGEPGGEPLASRASASCG